MSNRGKIELVFVVGLLLASFLVVATIPRTETPRIQQGYASFTLASWEYPDSNGQGIWGVYVYENSTGSWVYVDVTEHDDDGSYVWTAGVAIKLRVFTYFNSTLTGAGSTAEGQLYQRHNVTVTNRQGDTIFSQANFTYYEVLTVEDPMWVYAYDVVLNFLPAPTQAYTVLLGFETYWALNDNNTLGQLWKFDASVPSYVDRTAEFNSPDIEDTLPIYNPPDVGDCAYFGYSAPFAGLWINWDRQGEWVGTVIWEYYNGAAWAEVSNGPTGALATFECATGWQVHVWDIPADWASVSVNGETYYYIRVRILTVTGMTTNPRLTQGFVLETRPSWHEVTPAQLYFNLLSNNLSGWFILLGLCMIAGSPTYLALAKKTNTLSMDKFYIFLVAFIFGWALLIGGIAP